MGELASTADEFEFGDRGMTIQPCEDATNLATRIVGCCGVVYNFSQASLTRTRELYDDLGRCTQPRPLDLYDSRERWDSASHRDGHRVCACTTQDRLLSAPADITVPSHEIAELIARHDPGPEYREAVALVSEDGSSPPDGEAAVLMKRAFHDCDSVSLKGLSGGYSANVFRANVRFADSIVGPHRPCPLLLRLIAQRRLSTREPITKHTRATSYRST